MQHWARVTWVVDTIADRLPTVSECDYLSTAYDPTGLSHLHRRYLLTLSTASVPADRQFAAFRAAASTSSGQTVVAVQVSGAAGLRQVDAGGLACSLIVATGVQSTVVVVVNDPQAQMDDDCAIAERVTAGLLRTSG